MVAHATPDSRRECTCGAHTVTRGVVAFDRDARGRWVVHGIDRCRLVEDPHVLEQLDRPSRWQRLLSYLRLHVNTW